MQRPEFFHCEKMSCTLLRIVCIDRQVKSTRGGSARIRYEICDNCKQGKEIMKQIDKAKPLEVEMETDVETKVCVSCKGEFKRDGEQEGSWKQKKYCSAACRKKEENRRAMEKYREKQAQVKMGAGAFGGFETTDETQIWADVVDKESVLENLLDGADEGRKAGDDMAVDDIDWNASVPRGYDVLMDALRVINGDRQDAYGNPEDSFQIIADLWSSYVRGLMTHLDDDDEFWFGKKDVALMMSLLKVARILGGGGNHDSYVDGIGYLALAERM